MSEYGVFYGPYFPTFGLNSEIYRKSPIQCQCGKYGPEKTPYLDTFHAVMHFPVTNLKGASLF